jgi:hypothetical protein
MISVLVLLATPSCGVKRNDTTGATRQIVSNLLRANYSDVKPTTTLGELGCDVSISEEEFESLGTSNDRQSVTILELANLARSKRKNYSGK